MKSSRSPQSDGTARAAQGLEDAQSSGAPDDTPRGQGEATPAANGGAVFNALESAPDSPVQSLRRPGVVASHRVRTTPGAVPGGTHQPADKAALAGFVALAQTLAEAPKPSNAPARQLNCAAAKLGKQLKALTPAQADEVFAAIVGLAAALPGGHRGAATAANPPRAKGFSSGSGNDAVRLSSARAELFQLKETAALLPESTQKSLRGTFARAEDRLTLAAIDRDVGNRRFDSATDFAQFVASPTLSSVKTPMDANTRAIFLKAMMARAGQFGLARPLEAAAVLREAFETLPAPIKAGPHGNDFDQAYADLAVAQYSDKTLSDFEAMIGTSKADAVPLFDQLKSDNARSHLLFALTGMLPQLDAETRPAVHAMVRNRLDELAAPYDALVEDRLAEVEPQLLPDTSRESIARSRALVDEIMDAREMTSSTVERFLANDALYGPHIPPNALGGWRQDDGCLWVGRGPRPKPLVTLAQRLPEISDPAERKTAAGRLLDATKHKVEPAGNQVPVLVSLAEASAQAGPELFMGVLEHAGTLLENKQIRAVDYARVLSTLAGARRGSDRDGARTDADQSLLAATVRFKQAYPFMRSIL